MFGQSRTVASRGSGKDPIYSPYIADQLLRGNHKVERGFHRGARALQDGKQQRRVVNPILAVVGHPGEEQLGRQDGSVGGLNLDVDVLGAPRV
jgi:hypothetical protein